MSASTFHSVDLVRTGRAEDKALNGTGTGAGRARFIAKVGAESLVSIDQDAKIGEIGLEYDLTERIDDDDWIELFIAPLCRGFHLEQLPSVRIVVGEPGSRRVSWVPLPKCVEVRDLKLVQIGVVAAVPGKMAVAPRRLLFRERIAVLGRVDLDLSRLLVSEAVAPRILELAGGTHSLIVKQGESNGWNDGFLRLDLASGSFVGDPTGFATVEVEASLFGFGLEPKGWLEIRLVIQTNGSDWIEMAGKIDVNLTPRGEPRTHRFAWPEALPVGDGLFGLKRLIFVMNGSRSSPGTFQISRVSLLALEPRAPVTWPKRVVRPVEFGEEDLANADNPVAFRRQLEEIHDFAAAKGFKNTLEVGLGVGGSACYILSATSGKHVAIDPFQMTLYRDKGLENVRKFGLQDRLEFHEDFSHWVLPRLAQEATLLDFVYIDGDHKFESVFLDFYYCNLLLRPGGFMLFDDVSIAGVEKAVNFVMNNYSKNYEFGGYLYGNGALFKRTSMVRTEPHDFYRVF